MFWISVEAVKLFYKLQNTEMIKNEIKQKQIQRYIVRYAFVAVFRLWQDLNLEFFKDKS